MDQHILKNLNEKMRLFCSEAGERAKNGVAASPDMGGALVEEMLQVFGKRANELEAQSHDEEEVVHHPRVMGY